MNAPPRTRRAGIAGLAMLGSLGCNPTLCPTVAVPAIEVEVYDATSGRPAWWGTTGVVREGSFVDSLVPALTDPADSSVSAPLSGAWNRPGRYDVTISRAGYATWTRVGVVAPGSGGSCRSVEPRRLRADLQPTPPGASP